MNLRKLAASLRYVGEYAMVPIKSVNSLGRSCTGQLALQLMAPMHSVRKQAYSRGLTFR